MSKDIMFKDKMPQPQNVPNTKGPKSQNTQASKCPNYKTSRPQNVQNTKGPSLKMTQPWKKPKPKKSKIQNVHKKTYLSLNEINNQFSPRPRQFSPRPRSSLPAPAREGGGNFLYREEEVGVYGLEYKHRSGLCTAKEQEQPVIRVASYVTESKLSPILLFAI
jgi:hypothetical protein